MHCIDSAITQLDGLRLRYQALESEALRRGRLDKYRIAAEQRATCFIWLGAILEAVVRDFAHELRSEVALIDDDRTVVRGSIAAICLNSRFSSASSSNRTGMTSRHEILNHGHATLSEWPKAFSFHDQKTVDDRSFEIIWKTLGYDGSYVVSAFHQAALREIRENRNSLAHGEVDPVTLGRTLTFSVVLTRVKQATETIEWLELATAEWLRTTGWRA